jgi:hypothetical protein
MRKKTGEYSVVVVVVVVVQVGGRRMVGSGSASELNERAVVAK